MQIRKLWFTAVILAVLSCSAKSKRDGDWWDPDWNYRVGIEVSSGLCERTDKPAELTLDLPALLFRLGIERELDAVSLRLVETGPGGDVIDQNVPFQFDPDIRSAIDDQPVGRLLFICTGTTDSAAVRTYQLYFHTMDKSSGAIPAAVDTLVRLAELADHEGQPAYRVQTPSATWYYHAAGGGFASIEDPDGADWIGFRPCCESGGEYRGIPNLWKFHPGYDSVASRIETQGPLSVRIRSTAHDSGQEAIWDIFPGYARMTLLKVDSTYWFLYEGTPGGSLEVDRDYNVISNGLRRPISESWHGDLPGPEWIYFGDDSLRRTLFLAHDDDDRTDQFWQMREEMVVFGFGREFQCCGTYMDRVPAEFFVGFAEDSAYAAVSRVIDNAWRPLEVRLGEVERRLE